MLSNVRAAVPLLDAEQYKPDNNMTIEKALIRKNSQSQLHKPLNNPIEYSDTDKHLKNEKPKVGIRGRKTFAFWTLVTLLLLLAAGNLLLTITIISVLRISQGMEGIELISDESVIRFSGNIDFEHVYQRTGNLYGFQDIPVVLESEAGGAVRVSLASREPRNSPHQILNLSPTGISINGITSFSVLEPEKPDEIVFSTNTPSYNIPTASKSLTVKMALTKRITSPINENLTIKSDTVINLHGTEGTHMDSKEMIWTGDQDIFLKSINGSIILSGREGVFVDIKNIPIAKSHDDNGVMYNDAKGQFKVCVCMPQGKLFRLPVPSGQMTKITCSHINLSTKYNPCL